jgi:hypothetical protein
MQIIKILAWSGVPNSNGHVFTETALRSLEKHKSGEIKILEHAPDIGEDVSSIRTIGKVVNIDVLGGVAFAKCELSGSLIKQLESGKLRLEMDVDAAPDGVEEKDGVDVITKIASVRSVTLVKNKTKSDRSRGN